MSLEEKIIEWSADRPDWQRAVLRRVAQGDVFTDKDNDVLVETLIANSPVDKVTFGPEHLPQVEAGNPPAALVSVAEPKHVNAITSDVPLTFEPAGMTIVYGNNASGKSGYARLLKRIAREIGRLKRRSN